MTASLIVAGYELIGATTNPEFRLAPGFDFGEGEPDQTTITSLYLDGDTVSGDRTGNRHMLLPLTVFTRNGLSLTENVDTLLQAVNAETFTVQWTPDGGLPIVFDAYRAKAVRPRNLLHDAQGQTQLTLDFFAKPFGRSPTAQSVTAAASDTQLDSFDTAPTGGSLDTSTKYEGTGSAAVTLSSVLVSGLRQYSTSTPVSRTYGAAKNLTGMTAVTMRIRWPAPGAGPMVFTLTLLSAAGNAAITKTPSFKAGATGWRLVSFPLTGYLGSLDLTTVTGYSLAMTSGPVSGGGSTSTIWVDDQRMRSSATALVTTTHAANLMLTGVVGSARAPANLTLTNGSVIGQFLLHSPPVDQDVDAQILTSLSTGSADQTITIAAANANLRGTFALILGAGTDGTAGTFTVTVTQKEDGTIVGDPWTVTKTWDVTSQGYLCPVGEITLPLYDTPVDNSLTTYTIRVNITAGSDRYSEIMLCDTRGQTIYCDDPTPTAGSSIYIDEPTPLQSASSVYTSLNGRAAAWSKLAEVISSGGPVLLEGGTNKFLAWVDLSVPTVTATYYPRWLDERVV